MKRVTVLTLAEMKRADQRIAFHYRRAVDTYYRYRCGSWFPGREYTFQSA